MNSFTVTNNLYLRNIYSPNRTLCIKANRQDSSLNKLNSADSNALHKAIKKLSSVDYEDTDDTELYYNLKAFADSYNYTISSTNDNKENNMNKYSKKIKELTEKYSDDLNSLGFSIDESSGYLKISTTSTKNISSEKFESLFGKNSNYMKTLSNYAKRINKSTDFYV